MGLIAAYTGLILWFLFLKVDSDVYPVKTYADLADRIYGRWARWLCNVLQSVQLIVNVGTICLSNGQSLSQISKGKVRQYSFSTDTPDELIRPIHRTALLCSVHRYLGVRGHDYRTDPHAQGLRLARKLRSVAQPHAHLH
jgi:hypothetical protein